MAKSYETPGAAERIALFYRNFNIVGALALAGVGIFVPPVAPAAFTLAGIDAIQAIGGDIAARTARRM